jgi:hypothetical protein
MSSITKIQRNSILRRRSSVNKDAEEFKKRQVNLGQQEIAWQKDSESSCCNDCRKRFGLSNRRHHCRGCGFLFCNKCSSFQVVISGEMKRVRNIFSFSHKIWDYHS